MKKRVFIILTVVGILSIMGCDKSMVTVEPDLNVTNYSVTDGVDSVGNVIKNVSFNLTGNADLISFYSGEVLRDYAFRNGRVLSFSSLQLSFSTTWQYGTQLNQFSVMASTDFNGTYTLENIAAANWIDITNRFTLATNRGSTTSMPSGVVDVTDLKVEGKQLFIGFKYVHRPTTGSHATWRIRDLLLAGQTNLGLTTMATQTTAGWVIVNGGPDGTPNASQIESGSVINLRGTASNTTTEAESWAITKAFNTSKEDLGPDKPINIKRYIDPQLSKYTYSYKQPGEYTVAFWGQNSTSEKQSSVVKTLKITIN